MKSRVFSFSNTPSIEGHINGTFKCGENHYEESIAVLAILKQFKIGRYHLDIELKPRELDQSPTIPYLDLNNIKASIIEKSTPKASSLCLYSSGTTGTPKPFTKNANSLFRGPKQEVKTEKQGRWLLTYQPFRWAGVAVISHVLDTDQEIVISDSLDPLNMLKTAVESNVDSISITPTFFKKLLLSTDTYNLLKILNLKQVTFGGEMVTQNTLDTAKSLWSCHITHIYASTDFGNILSVSDGKSGIPKAKFENNRFTFIENQLFINEIPTGDFWIESDDGSRYHFNGRKSDVINIGGNKVSLLGVEELALTHPKVKHAVATAISNPLMGHLIELQFLGDVSEDELYSFFLQKENIKYKRPSLIKKIYAVSSTSAGKTRR